jgi:phage-related protein
VGLNIIKAVWNTIWNAIKAVAQTVWNGITFVIRNAVNIIRSILNFFSRLFQIVARPFQVVWNFIKGVLSSMVSGIRTAASKIGGFFSGMWDALKSGAKAAVNFAISILNGVISAINTVIDGINNLPFVDIGKIPKVPRLAHGGVVTSPTLAVIGEGNEDEAVLPLSKLGSMLNSARSESTGGNMNPQFDVIVTIGGKPIEDMVDVRIRERERNIRRQVPVRGRTR